MPSHSPAPSEVAALIADRIASGHYPDLLEAQVTVNALFAYAPDGKPAVKHNGRACHAKIKINSAKDRVEHKSDATMTIDGRAWADEWTDEEKVGLIDHELEHLIVRRNKPTKKNPGTYILSDDAGRPKLKNRPHDFECGWFMKIAERHGAASFERKQAATLRDEYGQLLWAWDDDNAPGDEPPGDVLPMAGGSGMGSSGPRKPRKPAGGVGGATGA